MTTIKNGVKMTFEIKIMDMDGVRDPSGGVDLFETREEAEDYMRKNYHTDTEWYPHAFIREIID